MSDITGNSITMFAAEQLDKAIESYGKTAAKQQIGKAIAIKDATGVKIAEDGEHVKFVGIVKAASGEARATFAAAKMVQDDLYNGSNPTLAPYYEGNVDIPKGKALTVERNCISYVKLTDDDIGSTVAGDLITVADDGEFTKTTDATKAVGRVYEAPSTLGIARAYIKAI